MFTKCSKCNEVRCTPCARDGDGYQNDLRNSFLQAYHDATDSHEMTEVRDECDRCGRQPCRCGGKHCEECRTKVQTRGCVCGITRCHTCLPPSDLPPVPMVDLIAEINLVVELQSALRQQAPSPPDQRALPNDPLVLSISDRSLPPLLQVSMASVQTLALASTASAQTVALASTMSAQPTEPTYEEKLETHRVALRAKLDTRILTGTYSFDTTRPRRRRTATRWSGLRTSWAVRLNSLPSRPNASNSWVAR